MSSRHGQQIKIPEPSIREFAYINRYWDKSRNSISAKILPGEFYVTMDDEYISTVLGSCVSACIRDRVSGIGGMNHFMLPEIINENEQIPVNNSESARYGNYAMEHMINTILKHGGRRENLEVKIVGGGRIIANMANIGEKNIAFVRRYLQTEGMNLVAEDVGDIFPRKVVYHPISGKVRVKKMRSMHNDTIRAREQRYMKDLDKAHVSGDVELFD
jgi:chemotaxis protein CheD